MARSETFEDLVLRLAPGERWTAVAEKCQITTRTLLTFRTRGTKRPHRLTVRAIAEGLGCPEAAVVAAVRATYKQAVAQAS